MLDSILSWPVSRSQIALSIGFVTILIGFIYAIASTATARRRVVQNTDDGVLKTMTETIVMLWVMGAACLAAWLLSGRDLEGLGLSLPQLAGPQAWRGWLSWGVSAAILLGLLSQMLPLRTPEGRAAMAQSMAQMDGVDLVRPRTPREHRRFQIMAVSAGWNEEIIFRGFLLCALALILPLWVAALASIAVFIGFHAYQGLSGMVRILPITVGLTGLVVLSGSLWPAILVHVAADIVGGYCLYLSQTQTGHVSHAAP